MFPTEKSNGGLKQANKQKKKHNLQIQSILESVSNKIIQIYLFRFEQEEIIACMCSTSNWETT